MTKPAAATSAASLPFSPVAGSRFTPSGEPRRTTTASSDLATGADPDPRAWLAAIVEGSNDAIISKDLDGIIQSWNGAATRLFGYAPEEIIGKSINLLIPPELTDQEDYIIGQIKRGEQIQRLETQRRCKAGTLVDVSLTISPIRNRAGRIVGASKIVRDITERRLAEERQRILMGEMRHRVKNLFALASAIVSLTARSAANVDDAVNAIQSRLSSLVRAHDLTMADPAGQDQQIGLTALLNTILEPYADGDRITVEGIDLDIGGNAVTSLALLFYEFATNSAKYGALSVLEGEVRVELFTDGDEACLVWRESGGPEPIRGDSAGFGSQLQNGVASALRATLEREWPPQGLVAKVTIPRDALTA